MDLARIILFVADIDAMERFYRDVVGLAPTGSADDDDGFRSLRAGTVDLALHAIRGARPATGDVPARTQVPVKIAFRVDDVAARRDTLARAGRQAASSRSAGVLRLHGPGRQHLPDLQPTLIRSLVRSAVGPARVQRCYRRRPTLTARTGRWPTMTP